MKTLLATALALLVATAALSAKPYSYMGCTKDTKAVVITIDLIDAVVKDHPEIPADFKKAFVAAVADLTYAQLRSNDGFYIFLSYLSELDMTALPEDGIDPPAIVSSSCGKGA